MPSSNTPLLNLSLLIDVTFSTPTGFCNNYESVSLLKIADDGGKLDEKAQVISVNSLHRS